MTTGFGVALIILEDDESQFSLEDTDVHTTSMGQVKATVFVAVKGLNADDYEIGIYKGTVFEKCDEEKSWYDEVLRITGQEMVEEKEGTWGTVFYVRKIGVVS
ncbi:hypothetical protein GGI00_004246, partial [Coemansia sp. RSA 2681]